MQYITRLAAVAAVALLLTSNAYGQRWQSNSDVAAGTDIASGSAKVSNTPLYYYIAATTSTDSDVFYVPRGMSATVSLNANTAAVFGTNTITINLMRQESLITAAGANNGSVMEGVAFTGGGTTAIMFDVPTGFYWLDITAATGSGNSLVTVTRGSNP